MIIEKNGVYTLTTRHTLYAFRVMETGQLEHLYYGRRMDFFSGSGAFAAIGEKPLYPIGNGISYDEKHAQVNLENVALEFSGVGKGDIRDPFLCLRHADGSDTCDFVFHAFTIQGGENEQKGTCSALRTECGDESTKEEQAACELPLPTSYAEEGKMEELVLTLKDRTYSLLVDLHYRVYEESDVITRFAVLKNRGENAVQVERLLSMQMDFAKSAYQMTYFSGAWAREFKKETCPIGAGRIVLESTTGTSSSRRNPLFFVSDIHATEEYGEVYGFNLVYSGNHYESVERNAFGKLRVLSGMSPSGFSYDLEPGESLMAPEAVMTYSANGFGGASANFHTFVREHIVRGFWKKKERPVLLNSWEAAYFQVNEGKLLHLAKAAKDVGIELLVMDDGWFGERNDDSHSLGDWTENTKKLPGGLKRLSEQIHAMSLQFGIWVEPEMVNVQSKLYTEHPEWVLQIPNTSHSEGRNQRMLDLGNPEVQEYIITEMSRVFSSAKIEYVKWDMNRIVSDSFSQYLPAKKQGEVMYRYYVGFYRCLRELTGRFPDILFEGCASGGNRFDLGMLCYFPQIWASDNTDAMCRAQIQNGYSYGYPQSTYSAHVSGCPNHQTLRRTPLSTRFGVAAFGVLGYECNLCDLKKEELDTIREQITVYKKWRPVLQFGQLYRVRDFEHVPCNYLAAEGGNLLEWTIAAEDGKKAVSLLVQNNAVPNATYAAVTPKGLTAESLYHFYSKQFRINVKEFGDLVNTISPIHIKQDSVVHNVLAKYVKMDGETEDYILRGDALMYGGVTLKPAFAGTGYGENVRHFPDYAARMFFCEEAQTKQQAGAQMDEEIEAQTKQQAGAQMDEEIEAQTKQLAKEQENV